MGGKRTAAIATGVVLASVRQGFPNGATNAGWKWPHKPVQLLDGIPAEFSPLRVAHSMIRYGHLGSLFASYHSPLYDEIWRWRTNSRDPAAGRHTPSMSPGLNAYEQDLHRFAVRIAARADDPAFGLIRLSISGAPDPKVQETVRQAQELGTPLAETISRLRQWFRGTVARCHLCRDLEGSLLLWAADHLTGATNTCPRLNDLCDAIDLLLWLLGDVEVAADDSPAAPLRSVHFQRLVNSTRLLLPQAAVVAPWSFQSSFRVARSDEFDLGQRHDNSRIGSSSTIPRPAIFVFQNGGPARLVDEGDGREQLPAGEDRSIDGTITSRSYLAPIQALLTALRGSRPTVRRLVWRADASTVDLCDANGPLETATLHLPIGTTQFKMIEILIDDQQRLITLHHTADSPCFSLAGDAPNVAFFVERGREAFRFLHSRLLHRQRLPVQVSTFFAVAVVWEPSVISIPLSVALPCDGESLRKHLRDTYKRRSSSIDTHTAKPPRGSFMIDYSVTMLRHGWYRPEYLAERDRIESLSPTEKLDALPWEETASRHAPGALEEDRHFAGRYLHQHFSPEIECAFPVGLKPFARQVHCYPLTVGETPFILHVLTDWETSRLGPEAARSLRAMLQEHVVSVLEDHGGSRTEVSSKRLYRKVLRSRRGGPQTSMQCTQPDQMFSDVASDGLDLVLLVFDDGDALFYTKRRHKPQKLPDSMTHRLLTALLTKEGQSVGVERERRNMSNLKKKMGLPAGCWEPVRDDENMKRFYNWTFVGTFCVIGPESILG